MYKTLILGNVASDVVLNEREYVDEETGEIRKVKVCNFTVAADQGYGKYKRTMYYKCNAWRGLGETCAKCLTKGRGVYIEGIPSLNNYVGTDKQIHTGIDLRVEVIQFIGKGTGNTTEENPVVTTPTTDDETLY